MSIETIREFFGWCVIINFGVLVLTTLIVTVFRNGLSKLHAKMSGLDEASVLRAYFHYMGNLKIAAIVFSLAPYLALSIMG